MMGWWEFDAKLHPGSSSKKNMQVKKKGWQHCHLLGHVSSSTLPPVHQGLLRADRGQACLENSRDAWNLRFLSTNLSSLLLFVHSNLKNSFAGVCPRLQGRKPWRALPPLTQLQLTTVWSDCWLPNRSSCQDSRDSRPGLSSSCHHPLRSWFMEEDLREELAAKTLRLNKSFQMGSVSRLMFS